MKYNILFIALLSVSSLFAQEVQIVDSQVVEQTSAELEKAKKEAQLAKCKIDESDKEAEILKFNDTIRISVMGQGVAPMNTNSPAQAYAMAKRAAIADSYRAIAEKIKGVRIDGQDLIKNMMVKRSVIRTSVQAMVRNANIVETTYKEGLCEVEMEIVISHSDFPQ